MSLDVGKLERVRELAGGVVQARCPACAEGGGDRKGEHLRIYPDGRYGCCVHPKDGEHRKRIFALAGDKRPGTFSVRLKVLAHGHQSALPAARSVKAALSGFGSGTLGTGKTELEESVSIAPTAVDAINPGSDTLLGTLGTPVLKSRACARECSPNLYTPTYMCKDWESAVPGVPRSLQTATNVVAEPASAAAGGEPPERLPYLTPGGNLVIPFDSPERYHWWKSPHEGRMSPEETLKEVRAGLAIKERMKHTAAGGGDSAAKGRSPDGEEKEEHYGDGV